MTEDQAQSLALSKQLGTISLTLRSILDSTSSVPEGDDDGKDKDRSINTVRFGVSSEAVSYTHLDVYKRQDETIFDGRRTGLVLHETREKGLHGLAP